MMNDVRDDLSKSNTSLNITRCSFVGGLEMDGSDIDIMEVSKTIEVQENKSSEKQDKYKTYFSMNMEETKPGFTYLFLEFVCDADVFRMCVKVGGKMCLSNVLFKQRLATETLSVEHGPCLSDRNGYFDYAFSLHSKSWVTPASQWITRTNDLWPTADVKQNIIDHGILFVPIGVKGSKNEEIEWRLSFSVGEKLRIYTFSHTQLLCYSLLKTFLKDVISIDVRCKDLLCSYFLKTIMLWFSEELQSSVWTPDNLIPCFMRCFRRLLYCVNYSVCPHYFITENNLFQNKIWVECQILLNNLYLLYRNAWKCILFSPRIQRFEFSKSVTHKRTFVPIEI